MADRIIGRAFQTVVSGRLVARLVLPLFGLLACGRVEMPPAGPADLSQGSRLQELLQARQSEATAVNYVISGGDNLRIRVQQMDELSGEFRVSEQGTVVLALLGSVPLAGLTERQAADKLRGLLADFVKDPQVTLAVSEIHGSQISVMGAVARPGTYPIRGFHHTVADVLTQAGGLTKEAGTAVYFSPASSSQDDNGRRQAAAGLGFGPSAAGLFSSSQQSLTIDLTPLYQGRNVPELQMPVRPGDMVVVPSIGEVYVGGWVNNPGAIKLTRSMTLSQAIASAGGLHFGASNGSVMLQRKSPTAESKTYTVDYAAISGGQVQDVYLDNGDRIEVSSNPAKSVPWGVFSFLKTIFSFGITGSAPTVGAK